jgi:hypothetical protein
MAPKVQYDCLFCDATYSIKNSFTNHVNKKHKKEQVLRSEEAKNQAKILRALSTETEVLKEVAEKIDIAEQLDEEEDIMKEAAKVLEAEISVMDDRLPAALPLLQQVSDELEPEVNTSLPKKKVEPPTKWMAKTWSGLGNLLDTIELPPSPKKRVAIKDSCGKCEEKDEQVATMEKRIALIVEDKLKIQSRLMDTKVLMKREAQEKDEELERRKQVIALQKREIIKLKEELQSLKGGKKKRTEDTIEVVIEQEVFKCDKCDFTTTRKVTLKAHKEVKHMGLVRNCDLCGLKCKSIEDLMKHRGVVHKLKTYKCDGCDFTTWSMKEAEKHKMSHNDEIVEESLNCTKCVFAAISADDLNSHIRRSHPGVLQSKRPCRFWKEGKCTKGEDCRFSHRGPQSPVPTSAPLGRSYGPSRCRNGVGCRFLARGICNSSHPGEERSRGKPDHEHRQHPQEVQQERRKCWFQNDCKRRQCSFIHDTSADFGSRRKAVPNVWVKNTKYNY